MTGKSILSIGGIVWILLAIGGCKPDIPETPPSPPSPPIEAEKAVAKEALPVDAGPVPGAEAPPAEILAPGELETLDRDISDTVDQLALVQVHPVGFDRLEPGERVLAYHLARAALAGRDIYADQIHREALAFRRLFEPLLARQASLASHPALAQVQRYGQLLWIFGGPYDALTGRKLSLGLSWSSLEDLVRRAAALPGEPAFAWGPKLLEHLQSLLMDPALEPLLTCRQPPAGEDAITASAINLYHGTNMDEIGAFVEAYPRNSRLVGRKGSLVEEIYRAGDPARQIPPGRYAEVLGDVIQALDRALPLADRGQSRYLEALMEYLRTGDSSDRARAMEAWLKSQSKVDLILGFLDTSHDPRRQKGLFMAMVTCLDSDLTARMQALADRSQALEDLLPWPPEQKRREFIPWTPRAVSLLLGVGHGGPMAPSALVLPDDPELQAKGTRTVLFTNVLRARDLLKVRAILKDHTHPGDQALLLRHWEEARMLHFMLHELVGHPSGQVSVKGSAERALGRYYAVLEEARADLVALYLLSSPKALGSLGVKEEVGQAAVGLYLGEELLILSQLPVDAEGPEGIRDRAIHLVVSALLERGAVQISREGNLALRPGGKGLRQAVAALLIRVMEAKAKGDINLARSLVEAPGEIAPELRTVMGTASPLYGAVINPRLEGIRDSNGALVDVGATNGDSLTSQMLRYSSEKLP